MNPLLAIARDAIAAHLAQRAYVPSRFDAGPPQGVFVTLHDPHARLRGCIGHLAPTRTDLIDEVVEVAILAATQDPRFPPVHPEELPTLILEISLLTPAEPIDGPEHLDPARYGVIVRRGPRRGVLLPALDGIDTVERQIAIATRKAGIPAGVPVRLERFEVLKIREVA